MKSLYAECKIPLFFAVVVLLSFCAYSCLNAFYQPESYEEARLLLAVELVFLFTSVVGAFGGLLSVLAVFFSPLVADDKRADQHSELSATSEADSLTETMKDSMLAILDCEIKDSDRMDED